MGKKSDSSGSKDIGTGPVMPEVLAAFIKENCADLPVESQGAVAQLVAKKGVPGDKKLKSIMDEFVPKLPEKLQRFILNHKTEIFSSITAEAPLAAKVAHLCAGIGGPMRDLPVDVPDASKLIDFQGKVDELLGFGKFEP